MEVAIQVVWWVGLIGALIATLVILKLVAVVLRALRDIYELANLTRDAARGIAHNVAPAARLGSFDSPSRRVIDGTRALAATTASLEQKLDGLATGGS